MRFRIGQNIRCIDNSGVEALLTIGVLYYIQKLNNNSIIVMSNEGNPSEFKECRFKSVNDKTVFIPEKFLNLTRELIKDKDEVTIRKYKQFRFLKIPIEKICKV